MNHQLYFSSNEHALALSRGNLLSLYDMNTAHLELPRLSLPAPYLTSMVPNLRDVLIEDEAAKISRMAADIAIAKINASQKIQAQNLTTRLLLLQELQERQRALEIRNPTDSIALSKFIALNTVGRNLISDQRNKFSTNLCNAVPVSPISQTSSYYSKHDSESIVTSQNIVNDKYDDQDDSVQACPDEGSIENINACDILCGRGGRSNHHIGNKRYRSVVAKMKYMYQHCPAKALKTDLSRTIVEYCYSYGARFVKYDEASGKYFVLSKSEARKKTSQALREAKCLKWTV